MVYETIRGMLAECLGYDENRIKKNTVVLEDLECTVDDLGEVLMGVEEEFGVTITEEELNDLTTVGDLAQYVEENM